VASLMPDRTARSRLRCRQATCPAMRLAPRSSAWSAQAPAWPRGCRQTSAEVRGQQRTKHASYNPSQALECTSGAMLWLWDPRAHAPGRTPPHLPFTRPRYLLGCLLTAHTRPQDGPWPRSREGNACPKRLRDGWARVLLWKERHGTIDDANADHDHGEFA